MQLFLKKKIKTTQFLVVNQIKKKSKKTGPLAEYDPKEEYFDTDDEDSLRIFAKQLFEDLVDNQAEEEIKWADEGEEKEEEETDADDEAIAIAKGEWITWPDDRDCATEFPLSLSLSANRGAGFIDNEEEEGREG